MKTLFTITLILHFLTEAMAAVTLIGGPDGFAAAGRGEQWSMHYGFAAMAIASLSLWVWPYRNNYKAITVALGVLLMFHASILTSLLLAGDQMVGVVLHSILLVLSLICFTQRLRLAGE